jgi:hypothetical protein
MTVGTGLIIGLYLVAQVALLNNRFQSNPRRDAQARQSAEPDRPAQRHEPLLRFGAFIVTSIVVLVVTWRGSEAANVAKPSTRTVQAHAVTQITQHSPNATIFVSRLDGGSVKTPLGFGLVVGKNSSLRREFIAIHQSDLPVDFEGTPGVTTIFLRREQGGEYRYRAEFRLLTKEPLRSAEIKFLTFDVWRDLVRVLTYNITEDVAPLAPTQPTAEWQAASENEVENYYGSLAFVSRVRLSDGRIVSANVASVLNEAQKILNGVEIDDLTPGVLDN